MLKAAGFDVRACNHAAAILGGDFANETQALVGTLLNFKLSDFEGEIKSLGDQITNATVVLYNAILEHLLPTPSKSHYLFNMRDLAKVINTIHE